MVKAIFFDIDGTLVSFDTHKIPDSTVKALYKLRKQGIKIFIATGRFIGDINNLGDIEFDGYITLNGAHCISSKRQDIFFNSIPKADIEALMRRIKEPDTFPCSFVTKEGTFGNYIDDKVEALSKLVHLPVPQIIPLDNISEKEIFQVELYVNRQKEQELMRTVFTHCESNRWSDFFADINAKGSNKGLGIEKMIDYYGIKREETMAFGDGGNDIPMLEYANYGIAMGNASENVKKSAGYITDTVDNDGVWNALVHYGILT